eukprot:2647414-Rhodomonas_salina.1
MSPPSQAGRAGPILAVAGESQAGTEARSETAASWDRSGAAQARRWLRRPEASPLLPSPSPSAQHPPRTVRVTAAPAGPPTLTPTRSMRDLSP